MMNQNNFQYNLVKKNNDTWLIGSMENTSSESICMCKVTTDPTHSKWTISEWFTKDAYQRQSIGKTTLANILQYLYKTYGVPNAIEYIWNGTNEYVYDWMVKHFDAVCQSPIWVQKTQTADDWPSHIYEFDVEKVLKYFDIVS